jgi:hypothetical protein
MGFRADPAGTPPTGTLMDTLIHNHIMYASVAIGLLAWATIVRMHWARLAEQGFVALFTFLASIHLFRLIGLIALLPQHLDPEPFGFTTAYLMQVGWGDALAAVLAAIAIWAQMGAWRGANVWAWAFVVLGTLDTLNAGPQFILAIHDQTLVGALGWLILTIYVPALLVTEACLIWLMLTRRPAQIAATRSAGSSANSSAK